MFESVSCVAAIGLGVQAAFNLGMGRRLQLMKRFAAPNSSARFQRASCELHVFSLVSCTDSRAARGLLEMRSRGHAMPQVFP